MAEQVLELIARIRPDGAEETADALEDVEDSFEGTASTVERESNRLEQFSEKFKGALTVAVTGLGIAVGAIASRIPVLGETATALDSILTSISLKISDQLRPSLQGLNNDLFGLSGAIDSTESDAVALLAVIGGGAGLTLLTVLGAIAISVGTVASVLAIAAVSIVSAVSATALFVSELAGLTNLTSIAQTEFNGWKGVLQDFLEVGLFPVIFSLSVLQGLINNGVNGAISGAVEALGNLGKAFFDLSVSAVQSILNLTTVGLALFDKFFSDVRRFAINIFNDILSTAEDFINNIINAFNSVASDLGLDTIGNVSLGQLNTESRSDANRSARNRALGRRQRISSVSDSLRGAETTDELLGVLKEIRDGEKQTTIQIDGRTVAKSSEPFLASGTATRGR